MEEKKIMDWKLEVIVIPVTDVDRAKEFYEGKLGFTIDVDHVAGESFRVVQATPPGSACSITFGINVGVGESGPVKGLHLIVDDIEAAHAHLEQAGVENDGPQHFVDGVMTPGLDPSRQNFGSFVFFDDPDGNAWAVQEVRGNAR